MQLFVTPEYDPVFPQNLRPVLVEQVVRASNAGGAACDVHQETIVPAGAQNHLVGRSILPNSLL